ncbi:hypothetical protein IMCC3317_46020 [Kordia antarctica]|uniref:Uncharacterized protein n=1 Tax=Kordia antarctica TaxID=1218801 RepID=A0A7L4ZRR0_9FLAO|nr:hypothetical protein IMCC3317_46020 [Kordia antarctica]
MLEKFKQFEIQKPTSINGGTATDDLWKWRTN